METILKNILIITSSIDATVEYIINKFMDIANFYRLDVDLLGKYEISIGNEFEWTIKCLDWKIILFKKDVHSIYYRKPKFPNLNEFELEYRRMISYDIIALINGIVDSFDGKVLTKPSVLRKCENKTYQIIYAMKNDFLIPKSFIGNDNNEMQMYAENNTIIKPLSIGKIYKKDKYEVYQTSYFDKYEEDISLTPIYLQRYEEKKYEVRLTIINSKYFSVKIQSSNSLDWRKGDANNKYSIIDVPDVILKKSLKMLTDFDLNFGAFDFIVNPKDEWIFLEVNPNGQWQWLEHELNLSISNEIVSFLLE